MATSQENSTRVYHDLIEINKTATKGYQEAAEGVSSPQLKSELSRLSQQRAKFASELSQHASQYGIAAEEHSTIEGALTDAAAAVHRGWINLKSAITGQDDAAILSECENGDATALKAYDTAMQTNDLPAPAKSFIEQQRSQILNAKNMITQWKGQAK